MHLKDLSPYFQLRAKIMTDMAVNFVLAAAGHTDPSARKDFPVTKQFLDVLAFELSNDICERSNNEGLPVPEGAWRTEELKDVARECLELNERIRPQFF
jgi:hypothetical protein